MIVLIHWHFYFLTDDQAWSEVHYRAADWDPCVSTFGISDYYWSSRYKITWGINSVHMYICLQWWAVMLGDSSTRLVIILSRYQLCSVKVPDNPVWLWGYYLLSNLIWGVNLMYCFMTIITVSINIHFILLFQVLAIKWFLLWILIMAHFMYVNKVKFDVNSPSLVW